MVDKLANDGSLGLRGRAEPPERGVVAGIGVRSLLQRASSAYLHPVVVKESNPSTARPAFVVPVSLAHPSPHLMPVARV